MKYFKSIFLYTILAFSMLTGCEKEELQNEIKFKAVVHKSTKAPIQNSWYAMTDPDFGIFAYRSESDQSSLYISNARCTNDKTNVENLWYTTPTSYWPASGTLTFIAYSPYMSSGVSCNGSSLTVEKFDIEPQDDFLYTKPADATGLTSTSTGERYEYGNGTYTTATGVPVKFRHSLSLVQVNVKTDSPGSDIVITSIRFGGFSRYGKLTADDSGSVWSQTSGSYSPQVFSGEQAVGTSSVQIGTMNMFIPTNLTDSHKILVSYKIAAKDVNGNPIPEGGGTVTDYPVELNSSSLTSFEPGRKYVLTLNINSKQMTFTASAKDWEDSNSEITL